MKLAWLINIPLPIWAESMGQEAPVICGWLVQTAELISNNPDVELTIFFPQSSQKEVIRKRINNIEYIGFYESAVPVLKYDVAMENQFKILLHEAKPDLVHIWGTEYVHTLAMVNAWNNPAKTIISIQGLVSIYAKHYMADLDENTQRKSTLRDFLRKDNLLMQQKKYRIRGKFEIQALQKVNHVFGRTDWDEAIVKQINPNIEYHLGGEILRESFYEGDMWMYDTCEKHSIFVTQSYFPIKGFHYILEALEEIIKEYPDTMLYVAGADIFRADNWKAMLKQTYYAKYINILMERKGLHKNIVFTGKLNEQLMKERYLKANVFVLPSSIENSPNSLAEAMILGVPCVSSYVGGISSMLVHEKEGYLYQHDASYMLAYYIKKVFSDEEKASIYAQNGMKHAKERHDVCSCLEQYQHVYNQLVANDRGDK